MSSRRFGRNGASAIAGSSGRLGGTIGGQPGLRSRRFGRNGAGRVRARARVTSVASSGILEGALGGTTRTGIHRRSRDTIGGQHGLSSRRFGRNGAGRVRARARVTSVASSGIVEGAIIGRLPLAADWFLAVWSLHTVCFRQ